MIIIKSSISSLKVIQDSLLIAYYNPVTDKMDVDTIILVVMSISAGLVVLVAMVLAALHKYYYYK